MLFPLEEPGNEVGGMKGPLYIKWNGPFSKKRQTVVSILGFRKIFRKPSEYWSVCLAQRSTWKEISFQKEILAFGRK